MAFLLIHRIFNPIRQLVVATRCMASGDLNVRVNTDRPDVTGDLARAFNDMAITVKKQREDLQLANHQLELANADLENRVALRTGELEAANKLLNREIAEKEDFLRAVSHDLNAPLRNISGMASMLLLKHRERLDEDIVHRLERICKNVEVETGLITELLELSRIKTRRQKVEFVEIGPLIKEIEGLFENDLKSKSISLVLDAPMPVLRGERLRFRQIFQNLIDNAIKYMGDAPVREIHIGCRSQSQPTGTAGIRQLIEFYVWDTGMGIHPDDMDKVFFVFRRGRNVSSVAGKGVGLASVKTIVETYGGTICVQSELGHGSTFSFTIGAEHVAGMSPSQESRQEISRGESNL
jgi:signal transduction histidine kinase